MAFTRNEAGDSEASPEITTGDGKYRGFREIEKNWEFIFAAK